MPELPEVEAVVRYLRPQLEGRVFVGIDIPGSYRRVLHTHSLTKLRQVLDSQVIRAVKRRAKFIVLELEHGILAIHLRMTGHLRLTPPDSNDWKHLRVIFEFADGSKLYFKDVRKFGRVYYFNDQNALDRTHGIEPLSPEFSVAWLEQLLHSKKRMLKPLLLDQKHIVGIGNIYADEVLWRAKLHPKTQSQRVGPKKVKALHRAIKRVLEASIRSNGTTFKSFVYAEESSGEFLKSLAVFERAGKACRRCKTKIIKTTVAQRGTHICPRCQRKLRG